MNSKRKKKNLAAGLETSFHSINFDEDFFFKFQRSEEKDGEVSSDDIKTGDCLINIIKD